MTLAYIAFGSNLGNRESIIRDALRRLNAWNGIRIIRVSPVYETEPEGFKEPVPSFLNGVAELNVSISAQDLLAALLAVEMELGRIRSGERAYQSRPIDLDLLLMGSAMIQETNLIVPHPRMTQRAFVLQPLADLHPELLVPGETCTIQQALDRLGSIPTIRLTELCVWNHL